MNQKGERQPKTPWKKYQHGEKVKKKMGKLAGIAILFSFLLLLSATFSFWRWFNKPWAVYPDFKENDDFSRLKNPYSLIILKTLKGQVTQSYFLLIKNGQTAIFEMPPQLLLSTNQGFYLLVNGLKEKEQLFNSLSRVWAYQPNGYLLLDNSSKDSSQALDEALIKGNWWSFLRLLFVGDGRFYSTLSPQEMIVFFRLLSEPSSARRLFNLTALGLLEKLEKPSLGQVWALSHSEELDDFLFNLFVKSLVGQKSSSLTALVFNASKVPGLAAEYSRFLKNVNIDVLETGNKDCPLGTCPNTILSYKDLSPEILDYLEKVFAAKVEVLDPNTSVRADLKITVGE